MQKLFEVQRDHAFTTHTYKHTTMGFLKDIEDMPNQFEYSKTFFDRWYRPEYTTVIVAGDVKPDAVVPAGREVLGRAGSAGSYTVDDPAGAARRGGRSYAHVPWTAPTRCPGSTVAFHGPAFSETEKDFAALDMLLDLTFGPTSDLYKRLVEQEQKVDQLCAVLPADRATPSWSTVLRARQEGRGRAVRARRDPEGVRAARAAAPSPRSALDGGEVERALRASLRALDNTEAIAGDARALRALPPLVRHAQRALPRLRRR